LTTSILHHQSKTQAGIKPVLGQGYCGPRLLVVWSRTHPPIIPTDIEIPTGGASVCLSVSNRLQIGLAFGRYAPRSQEMVSS